MLAKEVMGVEEEAGARLGTRLRTSQSLFLSITTTAAVTPNTASTPIITPAIPPPLMPSVRSQIFLIDNEYIFVRVNILKLLMNTLTFI